MEREAGEVGRAGGTETREERERESAASQQWVVGVRTQQLANITAS